jgi:hypothetical protein
MHAQLDELDRVARRQHANPVRLDAFLMQEFLYLVHTLVRWSKRSMVGEDGEGSVSQYACEIGLDALDRTVINGLWRAVQ